MTNYWGSQLEPSQEKITKKNAIEQKSDSFSKKRRYNNIRNGTGNGSRHHRRVARPKGNECLESLLRIRDPSNHQEEVVKEVIPVKAVIVLGKEDGCYTTINRL